jgi:serine protease Do
LDIKFSKFGLMWENVTPAQAADMGKPSGESVLVTMVAIAGPADRAGIRPLDAILELNGSKLKNFSHFSLLLDGIASGTKTSLVLLRRLKAPDMYPEQNVWDTLTVEMETR